jgi:hypothetical protein
MVYLFTKMNRKRKFNGSLLRDVPPKMTLACREPPETMLPLAPTSALLNATAWAYERKSVSVHR